MKNYLDLIKQHTGVALIYNGTEYTYEELADFATQFQETINKSFQSGDRPQQIKSFAQDGDRSNNNKQLYIIKEDDILAQLVKFLGCQGTDYIPVIAPQSFDSAQGPLYKHLISDKVVMAVMTSGTTGSNKIYTRSFNSWADFFPIQNDVFRINKTSKVFTQGSLAFTGNLNTYMGAFYAGATILAESDFNPKKWVKRINDYGADVIYLIPSKLLCLTRIKEQMTTVKSIMSGSESLGKSDIPKLKQVFPNTEITLYYGASETNYITYTKDHEMNEKRNLIGRPFEGIGVSLAADDRFIVDSPYHVEEVTSPYIINDVGSMDKNRMYYFEGRIDDIINIKGIKTSLHKIKNALEELLPIKEAVVRYENQVIEAEVILNRSQESNIMIIEQIKKDLHDKLQSYEIPRKIVVVETLDKNESGKVILQ